jgi:hypothetical protein
VQRQVEALAAGESAGARREAIVARLRAAGLEPSLAPFDPPADARVPRRGANVVATIPAARGRKDVPTLLLGAHYDRVAYGRGVVDNAAGVAAVLELAEALARRPLARYAVTVALFDLEEAGLLGSRAMAADSLGTPRPAVVLNLDIFGYGDALWVGADDGRSSAVRALEAGGREAGLAVLVDSAYPSSDHLSFRRPGTQSVAVALLDRADIEAVRARLRGGPPPAETTESGPPKIFRVVHSDEDTIDKLDAAAVARGVDALERAIRALDAARGRPGVSAAAPRR